MTVPNNILQTVQTYQTSGLAYLQNLNCFVATANTKFKDFEKMTANLGDTVTFDLPPRFTTTNSLVATFQPADQRVQNLVVNQQISTSYAFTAQQFIFNVEDYMVRFGKSAAEEISANIEASVATNCVTAPYRFYGDGVTPINNVSQLAYALAQFHTYGSAKGMAKMYLQDTSVPAIVNSGLNQFAIRRNDEFAMSWELGEWDRCKFYVSNLLPVQIAGTAGQEGLTLTVVSTVLNSQGAVTAIQFSISGSPGADPNMVQANDSFVFNDGVSGQPNMRYLTFVGHKPSSAPVQFRATAQAASNGGSDVTVSIYPPLQANATNDQNISYPIVAGMQCSVLPSHRAGVITAGDPLYLAMPALPEEVPFPTARAFDPDTGVSYRQYYGSLFGQNTRGMIHDCIWGSTLVPEYSMKLVFPL